MRSAAYVLVFDPVVGPAFEPAVDWDLGLVVEVLPELAWDAVLAADAVDEPIADPLVLDVVEASVEPTADPDPCAVDCKADLCEGAAELSVEPKPALEAPVVDPSCEPWFEPLTWELIPAVEATVEPDFDTWVDERVDPRLDPDFDAWVDERVDPTLDPVFEPTFELTLEPALDPRVEPLRFEPPVAEESLEPVAEDPIAGPALDDDWPVLEPILDPVAGASVPSLVCCWSPVWDPVPVCDDVSSCAGSAFATSCAPDSCFCSSFSFLSDPQQFPIISLISRLNPNQTLISFG